MSHSHESTSSDATPVPVPCEPWCAHHDDAGAHDQWCVSERHTIVPARMLDGASVSVEVLRHAGAAGAGEATVYVDIPTEGVSLLPSEAGRLMRLLAAARDLAEGVAAGWEVTR